MAKLTRDKYLGMRAQQASKLQIRKKYKLEHEELHALLVDWGLDTAMGEIEALREYVSRQLAVGAEVRAPKALRRKLGRSMVLVPVDMFAAGPVQLAADFEHGSLLDDFTPACEDVDVKQDKPLPLYDAGSVQLALDFNGETVWRVRGQGAEWETSRLVAAAVLYELQRAQGVSSSQAIAKVAAAVGVSPAATYQRLKTAGLTPRDHKLSAAMRRYYRSKKKQTTRCSAGSGC